MRSCSSLSIRYPFLCLFLLNLALTAANFSLVKSGTELQPRFVSHTDTEERIAFEIFSPEDGGTVVIQPEKFPIVAGKRYWVEQSHGKCGEIIAEKDRELTLEFGATLCNWVDISPAHPALLHNQSVFKQGTLKNFFPTQAALLTGISISRALDSFEEEKEYHANTYLLSPAGNGLGNMLASPWIDVKKGERYLASAEYHTEDPAFGSAVHFAIQFQNVQGSATPFFSNLYLNYTPPGEWQQLSVEARMPDNGKIRVCAICCGEPFHTIWKNFDLRLHPAFLRKPPVSDLPQQSRPSPKPTVQKTKFLGTADKDGRSVFLRDGVPTPFVALYTFPDASASRLFGDAGIPIQYVTAYSGFRANRFWIGKDQYDFTRIDEILMKAWSDAPDASLMVTLMCDPYRSFTDDFPEAAARGPKGKKTNWRFKEMDADSEGDYFVPSYSSPEYQREMVKMIQAFAAHVQTMPYGNSIAGFHVAGGNDNQWFPPHFDQSPGAIQDFRNFLRKKYHGDVARFQEAWHAPEMTFDTVPMVDYENIGDGTLLLSPQTNSRQIDFNQWRSAMPLAILRLAADTLRESFQRPLWLSCYFPDIMSSGDPGKDTIDEILDDDSFQAFTACLPYGEYRRLGDTCGVNSLAGSLALHGKLLLGEMDYRGDYSSFGQRGTSYDFNGVGAAHGHDGLWYQTVRDLGMLLCAGHGGWFFTLSGMTWADAKFQQQIADAVQAARRVAENPSSADRPLLQVFVDSDLSGYSRQGFQERRIGNAVGLIRKALARSGLGYECYSLKDLQHPQLPKAKVILFALASHLSDKQVDYIKNNLQKDGNVLIFTYDTGRLADIRQSDSTERVVNELTGIRLKRGTGNITYRNSADSPWRELAFTGYESSLPEYYVADDQVTPLAFFADDPEKCSAALKKHRDWTGIYIAAPCGVTPTFLNRVATEAGLTPFADPGDVLYSGNGLVVIHAVTSGTKTLHFQKETDLLDPVSGESVAQGVKSFSIDMRFGESRWFLKR